MPQILWPADLLPVEASWENIPASASVTFASGRTREFEYISHLWRCEARFVATPEVRDLRALEALLERLRGPSGRVSIPRWDQRDGVRGGMAMPEPTISQDDQLGDAVTLTGVNGTNPVLLAGDLISWAHQSGEVQHHMYRVAEDVNASGGAATVPLTSPLKFRTVAGRTVRFRGLNQTSAFSVRTVMRLLNNRQAKTQYRPPTIGEINVIFIEALEVP